jgi:hypothetical protein
MPEKSGLKKSELKHYSTNPHNKKISNPQKTSFMNTPLMQMRKTEHDEIFNNSKKSQAIRMSPNSVEPIQMAGHEGTFHRISDERIAKITSSTESNFYNEYGNRLRGIMPEHFEPSEEAREGLRAPEEDEAIIEMENLMGNIEEPIVFDIKIGESTASYDEIRKSKGKIGSAFKKMKMTISDWATGSRSPIPFKRSRGWRLIPQRGQGTRIGAGRYSKEVIINQLSQLEGNFEAARLKIEEGIREIYRTFIDLDVTFVAASVLIVIDPVNIENTKVKLIDFAHPIKSNEAGYRHYRTNFIYGIYKLLTFFQKLEFTREV